MDRLSSLSPGVAVWSIVALGLQQVIVNSTEIQGWIVEQTPDPLDPVAAQAWALAVAAIALFIGPRQQQGTKK